MKEITTERLLLRNFREEDFEDLYEYLSDEKVVAFEPYKPMNRQEVQDNLNWRISTDEMTAVEQKDTHKVIGNVYLGKRELETCESGYVFNRNYRKKGYAREACKAFIEQAFIEQTFIE